MQCEKYEEEYDELESQEDTASYVSDASSTVTRRSCNCDGYPERIVRYDNALYIIRDCYTTDYFHEYFLWKLNPDKYIYEFMLDNECFTCDDKKQGDTAYQKALYKKIQTEMERIPPSADIQAIFLDCLRQRYIAGTTNTITAKEIEAREAIHVSAFKKEVLSLFDTISKEIYKAAKKGHTGLKADLRLSENTMTNWGKLPIFYTNPNADGKRRTTYKDYLLYIALKAYPMHAAAAAQVTTEEDVMGEEAVGREWIVMQLCKELQGVYKGIRFSWETGDKEAFPTLLIQFPFSIQGVLS
jgi:hypothetical protein